MKLGPRTKLTVSALFLGCFLAWGGDWLTDGGNPQRTGWQRDEKILNLENVKNMKLLWKLHLDNEPRQMHSLFPPLIVERVKTRYADLKQASADRCPRLLGTFVKEPEVQYHHEVYNQFLWNLF